MGRRYSKTGWYAVFESAEQPERLEDREVEAFSAAREALVVDSQLGRLVPAYRQPGFVELRACARLVSVVSCQPGWYVSSTDNGHEWRAAVVAWMVSDDGMGVPLIPSRTGCFGVPADPTAILVGPDGRKAAGPGETVNDRRYAPSSPVATA